MDCCGRPSTTVQSYIHKCHFRLSCAEKKPYVNFVGMAIAILWALRWAITVETCVMVKGIHIPDPFCMNGLFIGLTLVFIVFIAFMWFVFALC